MGPAVAPVGDDGVPEFGVLGLEHPVAFVGEVEHLRGNALPLQRGEELHALRDVEAHVELRVDDQRGGFGVLDEAGGRPLAEGVLVGGEVLVTPGFGGMAGGGLFGVSGEAVEALGEVGGGAELPLVEPHLFGGAPGAGGVVHAVVGDDALETVGVGEHPVGHEAAVAGAEGALAGLVDKGILRFGVIEAAHEVGEGAAAPVAGYFVHEFLSVACRPAAVDADDDVARGGHQLPVPAIAPGVALGGLRAAMHDELQGVFLGGIEVGGLEEKAFDLGVVDAREPEGF